MRKWVTAMLLLFFTVTLGISASAQELKIKLFKAGKADAFLFRMDGRAMLLDAGEADDAEDILAYARAKEVDALDMVIVSHYDKGHIGGLPDILAALPTARVLLPDAYKNNDASRALYKALMKAGIEPEYVRETMDISWQGIIMTIYPAPLDFIIADEGDHDDASLVVSVVHNANKLLFTGDIATPRMEQLLSSGIDLAHAFLKVPAHGRNTDAMPRFLDAVQPKLAVITCSAKNPPSGAVMKALNTRGVQVWLTMDGDIALTSDGQNFRMKQ